MFLCTRRDRFDRETFVAAKLSIAFLNGFLCIDTHSLFNTSEINRVKLGILSVAGIVGSNCKYMKGTII